MKKIPSTIDRNTHKPKSQCRFPLNKSQRKILRFCYRFIEKKGRTPTSHEIAMEMGSFSKAMMETLREKNWFIRINRGLYWPAGVDRNITFRYPATMFVRNRTPRIQLDDVKTVDGDPCTMERLLRFSQSAIALGVHHDDAVTIAWAIDVIYGCTKAVNGLVYMALPVRNRKMIVPMDNVAQLRESIPRELPDRERFAIT